MTFRSLFPFLAHALLAGAVLAPCAVAQGPAGAPRAVGPRWETWLGARGGPSIDTITAVHERLVPPLPGQVASADDRIVTVVGTTRQAWWHRPGGTTFGAFHPSPGLPALFVAVFDRRVTSGVAPANTPCVGGSSTGCWDQLVYAVVLGSNNADEPLAVHVDDDGLITIVGWTASPEFPTTPDAWDRTFGGGREGFLLRLDPDVANPGPDDLRYATFLGGSGSDEARAVAVHGTTVYVACASDSRDWLVTPNAYRATPVGGRDVVLVALDLALAGPAQATYVTYLGSDRDDEPRALALEGDPPRLLVAGTTHDDFRAPTWPVHPVEDLGNGAFGPATCFMPVDRPGSEGFFARLDPQRAGVAGLLDSTYVGGDGDDAVNDLVVRAPGRVVLVGETTSSDFPDGLRYDAPGRRSYAAARGGRDGFVLELTDALRDPRPGAAQEGREVQVPYVTHLGTPGDDRVLRAASYGAGALLLAGLTEPGAPDAFPTTPGAFQERARGDREAFLAVLEPDLGVEPASGQLAYATLLGGERAELALALSHVPGDDASLLGVETLSTFAVTTGCVWLPQRCEETAPDLYLAHLGLPTWVLDPLPASAAIGEPLAFTWRGDLAAIGETVALEWSVDETRWSPLATGLANDGAHDLRLPCPDLEGAGERGVVFRVRSETRPLHRARSNRVAIEPLRSPLLVDRARIAVASRAGRDAFSLGLVFDPGLDPGTLQSGVDGIAFTDARGNAVLARWAFAWDPARTDARGARGSVHPENDPTHVVGTVRLDLRRGRAFVRARGIDLAATLPEAFAHVRLGAFESFQSLSPYAMRGGNARASYRRGDPRAAAHAAAHLFVDRASFRARPDEVLAFDVRGTLALPRFAGCPNLLQPPRVLLRAQEVLATVLTNACDGSACTWIGSFGAGTFRFELDTATGAFRLRGEEPGLRLRPASSTHVSFALDVLVDELVLRTELVLPAGNGRWRYPGR